MTLGLAVEPRFLAVSLGLIVLLALLEQAMRRGVASRISSCFVVGLRISVRRTVPGMELFQNLASRFGSMLAFRVILRTFLNSFAVFHISAGSSNDGLYRVVRASEGPL